MHSNGEMCEWGTILFCLESMLSQTKGARDVSCVGERAELLYYAPYERPMEYRNSMWQESAPGPYVAGLQPDRMEFFSTWALGSVSLRVDGSKLAAGSMVLNNTNILAGRCRVT
jgi:hypothetical protein